MGNIGNKHHTDVDCVTRNVAPMFPFMFPREVRNKMVWRGCYLVTPKSTERVMRDKAEGNFEKS